MNSCAVCCYWPSPMAQWVKNLPAMQKTQEFDPWVKKIPWRRKWQPTPVFLSVKPHGQRSLAVYNPWGGKELDTIEQFSTWCCCLVPQSCLTRLLCPWGFPGKNTGARCPFLLQGPSQSRDWTRVSCIAGGFFTTEPSGRWCHIWISRIIFYFFGVSPWYIKFQKCNLSVSIFYFMHVLSFNLER